MNILIIGGTKFVGRHIAEKTIANGHSITLFNRGETNPDILPKAVKLVGDRDGNMKALEGRTWDCVIDTCGYFPRIVRQSANLLKDAVGMYMFISTISVYEDEGKMSLPEDGELKTIEDKTVEEIREDTYGALKVLCEQAILDAYGDRALIVRPGLIVGPYDPTDRFTYWIRHMKQAGPMLVPDVPDQPVQYIDGRDLAKFVIKLIENNVSGVYNATGPKEKLTLGKFLKLSCEITNGVAEFVNVPDAFLRELDDVEPFRDIPFWMSTEHEPYGMMQADLRKAIDAGLTFTSLERTIADTLAWDATRPEEDKYFCGLKPERERELLELWAKEQAQE